MEISGVALKSTVAVNQSQKNDSSAEIQKLERQKKDIQQQLKELEQSKQGDDAIKNAKDNLQKQLQEIDKQIQMLKQQGRAEAKPTGDGAKANPPRFDEYIKNDKEAPKAGIYSVEKDEKPKIMKCTVSTDKVDSEIKKLKEQRQATKQQLNQAENPEEKATLQKKLANIEMELQAKDNDAYRKQNATYTESKES